MMSMRPLILAACVAVLPLAAAQTICIDPGHPSENVGTKGKIFTEIALCWKVGKALETRLKTLGYTVVLTKSAENQKVLNADRARVANKAKARLCVRLHCDAGTASGSTVYYPDKEGTAQGKTGPSKKVRLASAEVAKTFHGAFAKALKGLPDHGVKGDRATAIGAKQGALTGSIFSEVPVLLVEMCVLQNPKDEKFMASKAGFAEMVAALAAGIQAAVPLKK